MTIELLASQRNIGSDFHATWGRIVLTIEVKKEHGVFVSYWFASKAGQQGDAAVFFELRLPLITPVNGWGDEEEKRLLIECSGVFATFIRPLLEQYEDTPLGLIAGERLSHEVRTVQAIAHLRLHTSLQHFGDNSKNLNLFTAHQYQLVKSFGLGTVIEILSKFGNVEKSTITRRVTRARDAGLIEKSFKTRRPRSQEGNPDEQA
jgi:hypothetical protein